VLTLEVELGLPRDVCDLIRPADDL